MEGIISAFIGGIFTLAAIWLQHYLSERKNLKHEQSAEPKSKILPPTENIYRVRSVSITAILTGVVIIFIGFVIYISPMFIMGLDFGGSSLPVNFIGGSVVIYGVVKIVSAFKGVAKSG